MIDDRSGDFKSHSMDRRRRNKLGRELKPELIEAARRYRDIGWEVIPLTFSGIPFDEGYTTYVNRDRADEHLASGQASGLAVVLGEVSNGLIARDFDHPGGHPSWAARNPELAATLPTARSGSGRGAHVLARAEPPPRTRKFDDPQKWGIDKGEFRGEGGILKLPPSYHTKSGGRYVWIKEPFDHLPLIEDPSVFLPANASFGDALRAQENLKCDSCSEGGIRRKKEKKHHESHFNFCYPLGYSDFGLNDNLVDWVWRCSYKELPNGKGERDGRIFNLCRRFQEKFDKHETQVELRVAMYDCWWHLAREIVGTKDRMISLHAYLTAWDDVECPHGMVLQKVRTATEADTRFLLDKDSEAARRIFMGRRRFSEPRWRNAVAAARAMRRMAELREWRQFAAGCREVAKAAAISRRSANVAMHDLTDYGLIALVLKGDHEAGLNSEWLWLGSRE